MWPEQGTPLPVWESPTPLSAHDLPSARNAFPSYLHPLTHFASKSCSLTLTHSLMVFPKHTLCSWLCNQSQGSSADLGTAREGSREGNGDKQEAGGGADGSRGTALRPQEESWCLNGCHLCTTLYGLHLVGQAPGLSRLTSCNGPFSTLAQFGQYL